MKPRFDLTEQAQTDILEIWCYIARDSPAAADRMVDRFTATYQRLAENPALGVAQDQYRPGLRCFRVGSYLIFYQPTDAGILVIRVLHGARQLENLL